MRIAKVSSQNRFSCVKCVASFHFKYLLFLFCYYCVAMFTFFSFQVSEVHLMDCDAQEKTFNFKIEEK